MLAGPPLLHAAAPAPAKKVDPDEAKARTLFTDGQKAYDVGQFQEALALYSEAYKLKPLPGFLFNIAQCQRQLGNYKEAAFAFGRFIDNSRPEAPNVELARELIDDMKRRQTEKEEGERKAAEARALAEAQRAGGTSPKAGPADAPTSPTLTPSPGLPLPPPPPAIEDEPFYKKGWFWGVAGVVVAGAAVGTAVALSQPKPATKVYPTSNLPDINGR